MSLSDMPYKPQHGGDRIVTIDCYDVTLLYVFNTLVSVVTLCALLLLTASPVIMLIDS